MQCYSFLSDLEFSDGAHHKPGVENESESTPAAIAPSNVDGELLDQHKPDEGFPAEQLMVAAYLSLILSCFAQHSMIDAALATLPQGDWWLPTRVLKAYVVMQNQVMSAGCYSHV